MRQQISKTWLEDGRKAMGIQIGDKAPDFKAEAYYGGSIQEIQLAHYQGHWVVLLFYPADFTFV
jgi:peroxiredoxin (alkyl hydroperoxide reductase subunit C)